MLAVVGDRIGRRRVDDHRAVVAELLLQARMAVVPERAGLPDRELVDEGLARADAGEADTRNSVHLERQQDAVPVDRAALVEVVGHREPHVLTLAEAK